MMSYAPVNHAGDQRGHFLEHSFLLHLGREHFLVLKVVRQVFGCIVHSKTALRWERYRLNQTSHVSGLIASIQREPQDNRLPVQLTSLP